MSIFGDIMADALYEYTALDPLAETRFRPEQIASLSSAFHFCWMTQWSSEILKAG